MRSPCTSLPHSLSAMLWGAPVHPTRQPERGQLALNAAILQRVPPCACVLPVAPRRCKRCGRSSRTWAWRSFMCWGQTAQTTGRGRWAPPAAPGMAFVPRNSWVCAMPAVLCGAGWLCAASGALARQAGPSPPCSPALPPTPPAPWLPGCRAWTSSSGRPAATPTPCCTMSSCRWAGCARVRGTDEWC